MTSGAPATASRNAQAACGACVRQCVPGQSFCGRRDAGGRLRDAGAWVVVRTDRLFDKPILHFGKDRLLLNVGSWGCNLRCLGCQNARLSWATSGDGLDPQEISPAQVVSIARSRGCGGVAYTYNEPAIFLDASTFKNSSGSPWDSCLISAPPRAG